MTFALFCLFFLFFFPDTRVNHKSYSTNSLLRYIGLTVYVLYIRRLFFRFFFFLWPRVTVAGNYDRMVLTDRKSVV